MKKFLAVLLLSAFFFSSCAALTPTEPTATTLPPTPTTTPDPCSAEMIINVVEELQALVNGFQATMVFANSIQDPTLVISPILQLQDIQLQIRRLGVPECIEKLKSTVLDYTDSVVLYLVFYLNQNINQEDFDKLVESSNLKWISVRSEFNTVLEKVGFDTQEVPQLNPIVPEFKGTGAFIFNEGPGVVNIHAAPNTEAEIIATLEAGSQAQVLGRNESDEWIQIDFNGTLGWVLAETVTISVPVGDLPVIEVAP